jgi:hypothetical protein
LSIDTTAIAAGRVDPGGGATGAGSVDAADDDQVEVGQRGDRRNRLTEGDTGALDCRRHRHQIRRHFPLAGSRYRSKSRRRPHWKDARVREPVAETASGSTGCGGAATACQPSAVGHEFLNIGPYRLEDGGSQL